MKPTISISMRAVVQRVNRKLRQDDEVLKKARGERAAQDVGEFYVVDFNRNAIMQTHVDPESLARELGVLAKYEAVAD